MYHYGNSFDLGDQLEGSWATWESLDHSEPLLQAASLRRAAFVDNHDSGAGTFIGVFLKGENEASLPWASGDEAATASLGVGEEGEVLALSVTNRVTCRVYFGNIWKGEIVSL